MKAMTFLCSGPTWTPTEQSALLLHLKGESVSVVAKNKHRIFAIKARELGIPAEQKGIKILCSGNWNDYDLDLRSLPAWMFVPHLPSKFAPEHFLNTVTSADRLYLCKNESELRPFPQARKGRFIILSEEKEMFTLISEPQIRFYWKELFDGYISQGGCVGPWICRALTRNNPLTILGESVWGQTVDEFVKEFRRLVADYDSLLTTFQKQFQLLLSDV